MYKIELDLFEKNVTPSKWQYCKSVDNHADIITRFKDHDLNENQLWWRGPMFLKESIEDNLCQNVEFINDICENDNYAEEVVINKSCLVNSCDVKVDL